MFINHVGDSCPVPPDTIVRVVLEGDPTIGDPEAARNVAWGLRGQLGRVAKYEILAGVGDVNSNERGSGARFNANKPDLSLIPADVIARYMAITSGGSLPSPVIDWPKVVVHLSSFQMKRGVSLAMPLFLALQEMDNDGGGWADCARVFEYGKAKYAPWNWAKGMMWSIPLACALRHIVFGTARGVEVDAESGLPHRGHIACNIVMLLWFIDHFAEGDDLPSLPVP